MLLTRSRLHRAAVRFAGHGWPVVPGAYLTGGRFECGHPGCPTTSCHPAMARWEEAATDDPARAGRWWRTARYSVLLVTGRAFDVLEVPAPLGARAIGSPRWGGGPVAATPAGRWMFLVRPGTPLRRELDRPDVVRHARGSWIPAPPTRTPAGAVWWVVSPPEVGWLLPSPDEVQRLLVDAVVVTAPPAAEPLLLAARLPRAA